METKQTQPPSAEQQPESIGQRMAQTYTQAPPAGSGWEAVVPAALPPTCPDENDKTA